MNLLMEFLLVVVSAISHKWQFYYNCWLTIYIYLSILQLLYLCNNAIFIHLVYEVGSCLIWCRNIYCTYSYNHLGNKYNFLRKWKNLIKQFCRCVFFFFFWGNNKAISRWSSVIEQEHGDMLAFTYL